MVRKDFREAHALHPKGFPFWFYWVLSLTKGHTMAAERPVHEVTFYPVRASCWRNSDREGRVRFATQLTRLYKKDGEYKTTSSLDIEDLLPAAQALTAAFHWIQRKRQEDRKEERSDREAAPQEELADIDF